MSFQKIVFLTFSYITFTGGTTETVGYLVTKDSGLQDSVTPTIKLEKFGNSIYYFGFIFKGSWYQGMQFCRSHHMGMVAIETKEENDFLFKQMKALFGGGSEYWFWTSGTTLSNNHWAWMSTGQPIIYANWFPAQPDNAGNHEPCLEVRYNYFNGLQWNDNNANQQLHVICEATVSKSVSTMVSSMCNMTHSVPVL